MFLIKVFISMMLVCKFLAAVSHAPISLIDPASEERQETVPEVHET
jgi:hypothetical protein